MTLEDAWRPIDDVAGTNVDTFVYMVERGDGLFCELHRPIIPPQLKVAALSDPSEVGGQFGSDIQPFEQVAYWRAWHNMKSLEQRGLDPLRVLVDRTPPAPRLHKRWQTDAKAKMGVVGQGRTTRTSTLSPPSACPPTSGSRSSRLSRGC